MSIVELLTILFRTAFGLRCAIGACPWKLDRQQGARDYIFERCAICGDHRWRRV